MTTNYRVTEEDLLALTRGIGGRSAIGALFFLGLLLAWGLTALAGIHQAFVMLYGMMIVIGLMTVCLQVLFVVRRYLLLRRQVRQLYDLPAYGKIDRQIDVVEDGIAFSEPDSWTLLRWQRIVSWYRAGAVIILRTRMPRQIYFIPCRIKDQGFDLDALTRTLAHKIDGAER